MILVATIEVDDAAFAKIHELASASGESEKNLVGEAVNHLHRGWIGKPNDESDAGPFKKSFSDHPANAVLRQKGAQTFILDEPFRYIASDGSATDIRRDNVTDLASVPRFLIWLVPRYGRHTLPALLHDQQIEPETPPADRERADALFRDNMVQTGVPFVRRWMMWAAVTAGTLLKRPLLRVPVLIWMIGYGILGTGAFMASVGWWRPPWVGLPEMLFVLASPLILSLLWLDLYRFGLITGYALLVLPGAIIFVLLTTLIYILAEEAAKGYLKFRRKLGKVERINPIRTSRM